nr:glycosyltransferase [Mycobacterium lepromatosis]
MGTHCDVEVLRNPCNKELSVVRNIGLAFCATDFVAFMDSDVSPWRG